MIPSLRPELILFPFTALTWYDSVRSSDSVDYTHIRSDCLPQRRQHPPCLVRLPIILTYFSFSHHSSPQQHFLYTYLHEYLRNTGRETKTPASEARTSQQPRPSHHVCCRCSKTKPKVSQLCHNKKLLQSSACSRNRRSGAKPRFYHR